MNSYYNASLKIRDGTFHYSNFNNSTKKIATTFYSRAPNYFRGAKFLSCTIAWALKIGLTYSLL